jgi:hypothetical protein
MRLTLGYRAGSTLARFMQVRKSREPVQPVDRA